MASMNDVPSATAQKASWSWLATAGLESEVSTKAIRFLEQSHVTRDVLDYFTSEEGQQVLRAYRARRAPVEAAPGRGLGRQKIPAAVRLNEGHYFAKAPKPAKVPVRRASDDKLDSEKPRSEKAAEKAVGYVKSFSEDRGYGFIASEAAEGDIYFRASDAPSKEPAQVGRRCSFTLHYKDGNAQARSLQWDTSECDPETDPGPATRLEGVVKSLGANYGFITWDKQDVYVDRKELEKLGSCANGQPVSFILTKSARGQPQAKDVQISGAAQIEVALGDVEQPYVSETTSAGSIRSKYW